MKWTYGGSIERFPVEPGQMWTCEQGKVMVRDLYTGVAEHLREADCVFVDPPWNVGNENSFRTKAGQAHNKGGYPRFIAALWRAIDAIAPHTLYVEIGKEKAGSIYDEMSQRFPQVRAYPTVYYKKLPCYVIRGSNRLSAVDYTGMDELAVIDRICRDGEFEVIADPCMGRGAVGRYAFQHGRAFRGTELNPARLAVMIEHIHNEGGHWQVDGVDFEPATSGRGRI